MSQMSLRFSLIGSDLAQVALRGLKRLKVRRPALPCPSDLTPQAPTPPFLTLPAASAWQGRAAGRSQRHQKRRSGSTPQRRHRALRPAPCAARPAKLRPFCSLPARQAGERLEQEEDFAVERLCSWLGRVESDSVPENLESLLDESQVGGRWAGQGRRASGKGGFPQLPGALGGATAGGVGGQGPARSGLLLHGKAGFSKRAWARKALAVCRVACVHACKLPPAARLPALLP